MRTGIIRIMATAALLAALAGAAAAQDVYGLADPLDNALTYNSRYFECNGTYQKQYDAWWLSTANPLSFRRYFTGTWYFEGVDLSTLAGNDFALRLDLLVYTNSKESGGKPTAAAIDLVITNPNSEEKYEVNNIRVEMNKDEVPIPTYVYAPKKYLTEDGRVVVELRGLGQIGVAPARMSLLLPKEWF